MGALIPIRHEIRRQTVLAAGMVFWFGGRPLRVERALGDDDAAPVIVEELSDEYPGGPKGQFSLWSARSVCDVMAGHLDAWTRTGKSTKRRARSIAAGDAA